MRIYSIASNKVLAHVAGPSGSGKTTLVDKFSKLFPEINFVDLDEFDEEAEKILNYESIRKFNYTDEMLLKLYNKRQELMDKYIEESDKPVIFAGHHKEGDHVLNIPTQNKFLLDVDAETSAKRAWKRSQSEDPKYKRDIKDLPLDIQEAQEDIDFLLGSGYSPMSADDIEEFVRQKS